MGTRSVVLTLVLLATSNLHAFAEDKPLAERAPDTMQARMLGCAACHGAQGEGTSNDYYPRLSGKPAGYLYNQLQSFRDGRRKYPPMNYLLAYLPDPYLMKIAEYFAAERPPFPVNEPPSVSSSTLALGKTLVTSGAAARKIPACTACHGESLTGMEPAVPGLLGLRESYISAQLGAWRYGTRGTLAPDCMKDISTKLADQEITAIAAYLASLPAPDHSAPMPAGSLKMPVVCGSTTNQQARQ